MTQMALPGQGSLWFPTPSLGLSVCGMRTMVCWCSCSRVPHEPQGPSTDFLGSALGVTENTVSLFPSSSRETGVTVPCKLNEGCGASALSLHASQNLLELLVTLGRSQLSQTQSLDCRSRQPGHGRR